jgi:hypothetical protein
VVVAGFWELELARGMPAQATSSTASLLQANPGLRTAVDGRALIGIYGVPFATDSSAQTTTDQFVGAFVAAHSAAFGVPNLVAELGRVKDTASGKYRVYTYKQKIEGLPVYGSVIKIPVLKGATEKIGFVRLRLVQPPAAALPADSLDAQAAINVVAGMPEYAQLTFDTPQKIILETPDQGLHRCWAFMGSDADNIEGYVFFVDTATGTLLKVESRAYDASVSGNVIGYTTPCCSADDPNDPASCPVLTPLEGIRVTANFEETFADASGDYEFTGLPDGVRTTIASALTGEWVTVVNAQGGNLAPVPPSYIFTSDPNPLLDRDFVFNAASPTCNPSFPDEFATAQVNAFVVTQQTHDWFRDLYGPSAIDQRLTATVNHPRGRLQRFLLEP